jgi:signal transduction histidine kinase
VKRRGTLAQRISLLAIAVAIITAVLAGVLSVGLIRKSNAGEATGTLGRLADAAKASTDLGANAEASQQRARNTLRALKIQSVSVSTDGTITPRNSPLARALKPADLSALLAGKNVSIQRVLNGRRVLIQGRPTDAGAIVLLQRRADATVVGDRAISRILWALVIAVLIAGLLGLLVAYRIARPLRRTAHAANALAAGARDVAVLPEGPSEVAEVGEAINSLASSLSHSEARQREFLLSVSHDLRTPLTAIAGYAESLADGVVPAEQSAEVGAIMLAESYRLNRLVADLLDLARLGAQDFRIDVADVDLVELARAAAQVWSARCAAAGVRFDLQTPGVPGSSVWARTDPARVRQVLDGLLENSLRVTPSGAPIVLAVRAEQVDGHNLVVAEVRDGGPGLKPDDLAVAFERSVLYERYRGVRQVGTGLGLAIVDGLVTRLGGKVEAGHAAEGGARFTVRLPATS